jgi:hypothetical protein
MKRYIAGNLLFTEEKTRKKTDENKTGEDRGLEENDRLSIIRTK